MSTINDPGAFATTYPGKAAIAVNWETISILASYWSRSTDPFAKWSDLNDDPFTMEPIDDDDDTNIKHQNNTTLSIQNMPEIVYKIMAKYTRNTANDDFYVFMNSDDLKHCNIQCIPITSTQLKHEIKRTKKNLITLQYEHEMKKQFPNINDEKKSRVLFSSDKIKKNMFELQYLATYKEAERQNNNQFMPPHQFDFNWNEMRGKNAWDEINNGNYCVMNNIPYSKLMGVLYPLQIKNGNDNVYKQLISSKYPKYAEWKHIDLLLDGSSNVYRPRFVNGILIKLWNSLAIYIKETREIFAIPEILTTPYNPVRQHVFDDVALQFSDYIYSEYLNSIICISQGENVCSSVLKFNWNDSTLSLKKNIFNAVAMDANSAAILDNKRYCKYTENCILFIKSRKFIKTVDLTSLAEQKNDDDDNIFDDNFMDDYAPKFEWKTWNDELIWQHHNSSNTLIDGYYRQSMIICGGKSEEYLGYLGFETLSNHCEIYNLEKTQNGWMKLPFLNRNHGYRPYIYLEPDNPNIVCCIGGNKQQNADETGEVIEKLDLRDCYNKWRDCYNEWRDCYNKWRLVDVVRYPQNSFHDGQYVSAIFG